MSDQIEDAVQQGALTAWRIHQERVKPSDYVEESGLVNSYWQYVRRLENAVAMAERDL
jgi:hypothetical protein